MNKDCRFSDNTKIYLSEFNDILDRMISGMTSADLNDSISHNFIVQMIPHHKAAIEMSENILKYTTNRQLQSIAQNIISEQTASIKDMLSVESCCGKIENCESDLSLYLSRMNRIFNTMFSAMRNACATNRINCDFMREMIPHHRGAVEMSENTLDFEICRQLKPILCDIIKSQKRGIMQMQQLLRCIRC